MCHVIWSRFPRAQPHIGCSSVRFVYCCFQGTVLNCVLQLILQLDSATWLCFGQSKVSGSDTCHFQALPMKNFGAKPFVLFLLPREWWRCAPFLFKGMEQPEGRILGPGVRPVIVNIWACVHKKYIPTALDPLYILGFACPDKACHHNFIRIRE